MSFLTDYMLYLADNALILGHRQSEWCGHGPVLEQDIAITNISLDLIGQARLFYQYAAEIKNDGSTEDSFAYGRDVRDFRNCLLTELPNGDWGQTVLRQFLFSNYQQLLYSKLQQGNDSRLAAIAAKALKEVTYHLRWSSEWVIRLGDGTEESHRRMENALEAVWNFTGEMFLLSSFEKEAEAAGIAPGISGLETGWMQKTEEIFSAAGLSFPEGTYMQKGGKEGNHTEYMGYILAELQFVPRAYPGAEW